MKHIIFKSFVVLLFASLFINQQVVAQESSEATQPPTICAGKIIPIGQIPGGAVLYKSSNLHGGRGPTFLVQNTGQRTNKKVIEIRNAKCEVIGSFGLYATDQPYGSRYYTGSGGSGADSNELQRLANLAGSNNILVEGINGTWIRVKNPQNREGSVNK